jgi:AraC-like DNA-binding protein
MRHAARAPFCDANCPCAIREGYADAVILASVPTPALRHLIRHYYQVDSRALDNRTMQPVPARSPQAIEFTFGTPYQVRRLDGGGVRNAHRIAVIGAQTYRRVELVAQGQVDAFTIVFQPGGIHGLFRVPAKELTNQDFDGEAVLGRRLGVLERRMGDVSTFTDRVRIANEYLTARLPPHRSMGVIPRTAMAVIRNAGCERVIDCADAAGLGLRQFERRFRYEIGMPPKLYARVVRFEAALHQKAACPSLQWTAIAHALGYHDQMHMIHDFNRLSGESPAVICGQLDMFVRPELISSVRRVDQF